MRRFPIKPTKGLAAFCPRIFFFLPKGEETNEICSCARQMQCARAYFSLRRAQLAVNGLQRNSIV